MSLANATVVERDIEGRSAEQLAAEPGTDAPLTQLGDAAYALFGTHHC